MTSHPTVCTACATPMTSETRFCPGCGKSATDTAMAPRDDGCFLPTQPPSVKDPKAAARGPRLRGRILRDTNAGPGLINLDGELLPFLLEFHWRGTSAPAVQMTVEVERDATGDIVSVTPVSEKALAEEKMKELTGSLGKQLKEHAPMMRATLDLIGIPTLACMAMLWLSWVYLAAVSVRIAQGFTQSATMFDVLRLMNSGNGLEGLGQPGGASSGLYGILCTLAIVAPVVPAVVKHRLAPLGLVAPLAFLVCIAIGVYWKVHAVAGTAHEAMGNLGGNDMAATMMTQVMQALSIGAGTYLSVGVSLYLAYRGAVLLLARA